MNTSTSMIRCRSTSEKTQCWECTLEFLGGKQSYVIGLLFFFVLPLLIWTFDFQKAKEKRRDAFLSLFFVLFFPGVRGMFVSHMSPSLSFLFKNKTFGVTSGRFHRLKKIKRTWIEYHKNVFISCFFETIDGMFSFFVFYKLLSFSLCAPLLFSFFSVSSSCCSYNFRNF